MLNDVTDTLPELLKELGVSGQQATPNVDWRSHSAVVDRARKYVAKLPGAVSGNNGHNQTFHAACVLVHGFELSKPEALDVMSEWNQTCDPPWEQHELERKVSEADKQTGERGYLRNASPENWERLSSRTPILTTGKRESDENRKLEPIDFEIIDSRTFAETEYATEFLIDGVMTEGQPKLYGGPSKSLKTTVLVDECLSLAAGVAFLGKYDVPNAKRVLLLSSESGCATLQESAVRICSAKGVHLADLGGQMHWGFRPPQLTAADHVLSLRQIIEQNQIDVLAIDPAYLSLNLAGNEASNQFAVGAVLMNLTTLQADTGATPILATHFRMHMPPGTMPGLENIAGAGFGQWARQWLLLNRREPFNDENPGNHQLVMAFGGSAGHAGAVALDINEGRIQDGRFWEVSVRPLSEFRRQLEDDRDQRKREKEQVTYENHRVAILRTMKGFPNGETKTQIRDTVGIGSKYFGPVFQDLLTSMEIESCQFNRGEQLKSGDMKTYHGFRIVSHQRSGPDTRTLPDSPGHCPEPSG